MPASFSCSGQSRDFQPATDQQRYIEDKLHPFLPPSLFTLPLNFLPSLPPSLPPPSLPPSSLPLSTPPSPPPQVQRRKSTSWTLISPPFTSLTTHCSVWNMSWPLDCSKLVISSRRDKETKWQSTTLRRYFRRGGGRDEGVGAWGSEGTLPCHNVDILKPCLPPSLPPHPLLLHIIQLLALKRATIDLRQTLQEMVSVLCLDHSTSALFIHVSFHSILTTHSSPTSLLPFPFPPSLPPSLPPFRTPPLLKQWTSTLV